MDEIFVGREAELAFLYSRLKETLKGVSRTVLLEGAAGAGKTALLEAFLSRAGRQRVLRASGAEQEAGLAYGVVGQLVAAAGEPPPERLAGLGTGRAADTEPLRIGIFLVEMLGGLRDGGPILVVVDDADWGDIPSLQALAFALRRLQSSPVLALLSVRDDRTDQLPTSLHKVVTGPMTARLRLAGLSVEELRELSTALGTGWLSPRAAKRLHEHTGGNPLHARALLEEIPAGVLHHSVGPLPAPRSFALLVLARLATCPPDAENLVVAASVLGTSCPLSLASRLGEVTDPLKALEHAAAAHLLREHPSAIERLVAFPHPLVRAAVYHDLGPARRADLHARTARLIGSERAALRHRAAAARGPDPELAAELAALAIRQVAAGSWTAAADNLLAAAKLAATPAERDRSVVTAIDCLRLGGNHAEASAVAAELAALAESTPRDYGQARLGGAADQRADASQLVGARQQDEPGSQPKPTAGTSQQLGMCPLPDARGEPTPWARQALTAALPQPSAATKSCDIPLSVRPVSGDPSGGCGPIALVQPIWPAPSACLGAGSLASSEPDRRISRGIARAWTDDLPGARDDLTSALTACQRRRPPLPWGLIGLGFLVETEYRLGAWDDAIAHAELAVSITHATGQNRLAPFIHAVAAFPLAARGAREAAASHASEATAQLQRVGTENGAIWAATAQALLAQAEGDDQRIASVLKSLYLPASTAAHEPGWQPWQALYAEALTSLGSREQAEAVLAPFEALAAARDRRSMLAAAARARGTLEAAHGHPERANAAFRVGLKHASDLPMPFERALLEMAYGHYLCHAGRSTDAAVQLQAAKTRFAQLDARPFLQRCEQELTACHRTPPKRKVGPMASLTRQELAVARLVADGQTNRETAAALVVSVKTIEYHLSNIYAKLGVTSRTQLALAIRQDRGNP